MSRSAGFAFFDVDGTLLPRTSAEKILARALLRRETPGRFRILPFLLEAVRLLPRGATVARKANKAYLKGATADEVRAWGERLFSERIALLLDDWGAALVSEERERGRRIVLLTGMPDLLLEPFARRFEADAAIGTALETDRAGRLTGRRAGPHPYGPAKREIARSFAAEHGAELGDCSAYGDHASDAVLLGEVGEPHAVDPDRGLERIARRHGWSIHRRS
ncbi:MAG: HAD-IB family hydrolase [Candidatus Eisenbacteria bacterium]|nr:HAD-IB family hydrolase [Candidatus Latescibacterota bacterium]MBD3301808.1 HAD-IB family hydrolase [Candidatus Eisenbacteria bacterium]